MEENNNSPSLIQFLKNSECPKCHNLKPENYILSCGHSLCKDCFILIKQENSQCFECQKPFQNSDPIKNTEKDISSKLAASCNLSSKQLCDECEEAEAVIWCSDCKLYFCSKDNEQGHKGKATSKHHREEIPKAEEKGTVLCPKHKFNFEHYFQNTKEYLCSSN